MNAPPYFRKTCAGMETPVAMHQINPTQSLPTKRSASLSRGFTPAGSKAIHAEFKQEYDWPKMWKELLARGIRVGKQPGGGLEHEAATLNRGPAARQEVRILGSLWSADNRGKVKVLRQAWVNYRTKVEIVGT